MDDIQLSDSTNTRRYFSMMPQMIFTMGLSSYAVHLYGLILALVGEGGDCRYSMGNLAEMMGCAESTVITARDDLERAGVVRVWRTPAQNGGRAKVHIEAVDIWESNVRYVREKQQAKANAKAQAANSPHDDANSLSELANSPHELINNLNINKSIPREAHTPELDPLQLWFESIGVMITGSDIPALNEMRKQGVTPDDLGDALAWWKENGRTIHSARQMLSSALTAVKKRKQAIASAAKHQKGALSKMAQQELYEQTRLEAAEREKRRAARRAAQDGSTVAACGVAAGAAAPG